jgi:hypothetical protein
MCDTSNFAERLVARFTRIRPDTSVGPAMTPDAIPYLLGRPIARLPSTPSASPPSEEKEPTEEQTAAAQAVSSHANDPGHEAAVSKVRGPQVDTPRELQESSEPRSRAETRREDIRPHSKNPASEFPPSNQFQRTADSSSFLPELSGVRPVIRPSDELRREHGTSGSEGRILGEENAPKDKVNARQREETPVAVGTESATGARRETLTGRMMGHEPAREELAAAAPPERRGVAPRVGARRVPEQEDGADSGNGDKASRHVSEIQTTPRQHRGITAEGPFLPEPVRERVNDTSLQRRSTRLFERDSEPTVNVHIGRIEVRAILPQSPPSKAEAGPALSLAEYLRRRHEANR